MKPGSLGRCGPVFSSSGESRSPDAHCTRDSRVTCNFGASIRLFHNPSTPRESVLEQSARSHTSRFAASRLACRPRQSSNAPTAIVQTKLKAKNSKIIHAILLISRDIQVSPAAGVRHAARARGSESPTRPDSARCRRFGFQRSREAFRKVLRGRIGQANRSAPDCVKRTKVPLSWSSSQPRSIANFSPAEYSARGAPIDVQERAVDFLNVDTAILHHLEGVGVLHQSSCCFFGISKWTVGG